MIFTELDGRAVVDRAGRHARVTDLAVDLLGGEYPPVTVLLVEYGRPRSSRRRIYQEDVDEIGTTIRVRDLAAAPRQFEDGLEEFDLLKRDVLDALVLDLDRQRAVRVNDLWLRKILCPMAAADGWSSAGWTRAPEPSCADWPAGSCLGGAPARSRRDSSSTGQMSRSYAAIHDVRPRLRTRSRTSRGSSRRASRP